MIERLRSRFDAIGIAFGRLTQREQFTVLGKNKKTNSSER